MGRYFNTGRAKIHLLGRVAPLPRRCVTDSRRRRNERSDRERLPPCAVGISGRAAYILHLGPFGTEDYFDGKPGCGVGTAKEWYITRDGFAIVQSFFASVILIVATIVVVVVARTRRLRTAV